MDIRDLEIFLLEVSHLSSHYEKMAKTTGSNFNVFEILNLQASEVRLHSSLIAEFLNPKGIHGQGTLFLNLFLQQFHLENFEIESAFVEVEKHIGIINLEYTEGGRIDIEISNNKKQNIFIENKIYASDQKNQLLRYYNYDNNATLMYLTLEGTLPSNESISDKLTSKDYACISYKTDIINWFEECQKKAFNLPLIRETITQYVNLLKTLTNQTYKVSMKEEIKNLILRKPEIVSSIELSNHVLWSLLIDMKTIFFNEMKLAFPRQLIHLKNNGEIIIYFDEDNDGPWFGYQYHVNGNKENLSEKGKIYRDILKKIDSTFFSNHNFIGWFNPKPFKPRQKFEFIDKEYILKLYTDRSLLKELVNDLIRQENNIRQEFLKRIKEDVISETPIYI